MENKLAEKPELGIIKPDAILVDALTKLIQMEYHINQ